MNVVKSAAIAVVAVLALTAGSTENINGNTYGDPKAPILIEVFSDFQCPACKAFHDNDFPRIQTDYIATGKVYVVYRYFPLAMHPYGRAAAEYACASARVKRYAKVADALFAQQDSVSKTGNLAGAVSSVLTPTELKTVTSLLKSPEVQHEIDSDVAEGQKVPVGGTPTLWVTAHGKSQVVAWPLNYPLFKQYLDQLLAK